jgi:hypothetical protein
VKKYKSNEMKILNKIFVILMLIIFSSCATHMGMISGDASLSSNNFRMVKMIEGTAKTTKIFGIGGLGKEALVLEAKKDLLQNYPLKDGLALANVTLDFKNSFILFVNTQKVTVSADLVEFFENQPVNVQENRKDEIGGTSPTIENITVPEVIKIDKDTIPHHEDNPPPAADQNFEPTIRFSAPAEIVTASGERFKVEAGDFFIGTLDKNGNPENGKLYDKKGQYKTIILPKRNH